jgi:RHS repeat-associated protein
VYNTDGTSTVTDANVNARTYGFVTQFGVVKTTALSGAPDPTVGGSAFTYDANGFIASKTDYNGNVTAYTHDARGNETSRTEASGTALARTTTVAWHPSLHLPTLITEPGNRTTAFTYDAHGNMLAKTVTSDAQSRTWQYTYNNFGQVTAMADPRGAVTRYTYDSKGDAASVTDALGHVTSFTNYDGAGRLLRAVDPNGLVTMFVYDARGRLIQTTAGSETTQIAYDAAGNRVAVKAADGSVTTFVYDAAHRLTGARDALGNGMAFALDGNDNRLQAGLYDPANNLVQHRAFAYDSVNRLKGELGAQGQETDYTYDAQGNLTKVSDPLNHRTSFDYDALNRRLDTTDANGGLTKFGYDQLDRLTAEQDPKGLTTGYFYDGLDDQTGIASPDTGNTVKTYDAAGNVQTSTDARGAKTTYTYDALNRVTKAQYADGTSSTYQYDQGQNGIVHLTRMTDPAGITQWTYDIHGRVTSKAQQSGGVTLVTRMAYDAAGRLASMTYPSGKVINVSYDAAGHVNGISLGHSWLISSVLYRPFGPAQSWKQGNNATFARTFDADGRITDINMGGVDGMAFGYDAANRITGINETGIANKTYGYDALDRLTGYAEGAATTAYTYDADGNRLTLASSITSTADNYGFTAASNRLQSVTEAVTVLDRKGKPSTSTSTSPFTYDATGNTISDGTHLFTYDARGRMSSVTTANDKDHHRFDDDRREQRKATLYGVNGLGERVIKQKTNDHDRDDFHKNDGIVYVYDASDHLLGEYDGRGHAIEETVYLGDLPVAAIKDDGDHDWDNRNGNVFYIAPDNLGASHVITDERGKKVWQWTHEPFGSTAPASSGSFSYDLRFPGQIADAESGNSYNMFRDYNPALGRYAQSDPMGLLAGVNTYGYVGNNPLWANDPFGLTAACPASPPPANDPSWIQYQGNPWWFHCGPDYHTYLENRKPTLEDPRGECTYDECNRLVDQNHKYAQCQGTPDQYDTSDWWNHTFNDKGGIWEKGWPAFRESRRHEYDQFMPKWTKQ